MRIVDQAYEKSFLPEAFGASVLVGEAGVVVAGETLATLMNTILNTKLDQFILSSNQPALFSVVLF